MYALLSRYTWSSNAKRMRSDDEVLQSNAEVLQSNAAMQQGMDEHDHRHKPVETSKSSTLNAEIVAQLRQKLKIKTAGEKRLQSELNQAKRHLSARTRLSTLLMTYRQQG